MSTIYDQLVNIKDKLETHYRDMQDMEFTIQQGNLYILQTRNGKEDRRFSRKGGRRYDQRGAYHQGKKPCSVWMPVSWISFFIPCSILKFKKSMP